MTDVQNGTDEFPTWKTTTAPEQEEPRSEPANGDPEPESDEPSLEEQLAAAVAERDEFLDQLQRGRAEFANFRRRNDQERGALRQFVSRDVLAQFLPVIDDLDRALAAIPEDERGSGWVTGITLIQHKLNATMDKLGVAPIDALDQPFDPALHEAVATEPGSAGSHVVEVYQSGYRIGDVLVRPAMVKTGDPVEDIAAEEAAATQFDA